MSKTKKGKKPIGFEYWGKRPLFDNPKKQEGIQRERSILKRILFKLIRKETE